MSSAMSPVVARLTGHAVPWVRIQGLGGLCAMAVVGPDEAPGTAGGRLVRLFDTSEAIAGETSWLPPAVAWVDVGTSNDSELVGMIRRAVASELYCSLTTRTAAEIHVAGLLMVAIAARRTIDIERQQDIELALHEAVSNALVHGNLGVSSMRALKISELDTYSHDMTARLADPALADRRLEVMAAFQGDLLVVEVVDQGAGYVGSDADNDGACGRGLALIAGIAEECMVEDGGRRITMRFRL